MDDQQLAMAGIMTLCSMLALWGVLPRLLWLTAFYYALHGAIGLPGLAAGFAIFVYLEWPNIMGRD